MLIAMAGCTSEAAEREPAAAQAELTQDAGAPMLDHVSCTRVCDYFEDHQAMPDVTCVQMCEYLVAQNPASPPVSCQNACAHYGQ